jgi:hypothetical protein
MAELYRWKDQDGDEAIVTYRPNQSGPLFLNMFKRDCIYISRDQARELAAALLKWAGPASKEELQAAIEDIARSCRPMIAVPAEPQPNTVRVRAAVAVNAKGRYAVSGHFGAEDSDMKDSALECLEPQTEAEAVHFIEATVPLPVVPVPQTIEGRVT